MELRQGNIYDYPAYYDLVFGSDWKAEFDFLQGCFERHATGRVQRVFEPACGTGRLLYRLARAGYEACGLDINRLAVEYCNRRLARMKLPESVVVGDMTDFRLPRRVDAAFNMINSFRHLTRARDARAHLEQMGAAIRKGGIYVLGMHLTPTAAEPTESEAWSARRGHLCVNTEMRTIERDLRKRIERFAMSYFVHTPSQSFQLADEIQFRTYTATQFQRLLTAVGQFEIAGVYDFAYDIEEPLEIWPETEDVVYVLRRR